GAVDLGGTLEAHAVVAEGILGGALVLHGDGDGLGDVLDGQVAGHLNGVALDGEVGALEGPGGVVLHVEEVGRADVAVAVGVAGVDRRGVDGDLEVRVGRVGAVDDGLALELLEGAADLGDHRVAGHEGEGGVGGVEDVGAVEIGEVHASSFGGCFPV